MTDYKNLEEKEITFTNKVKVTFFEWNNDFSEMWVSFPTLEAALNFYQLHSDFENPISEISSCSVSQNPSSKEWFLLNCEKAKRYNEPEKISDRWKKAWFDQREKFKNAIWYEYYHGVHDGQIGKCFDKEFGKNSFQKLNKYS